MMALGLGFPLARRVPFDPQQVGGMFWRLRADLGATLSAGTCTALADQSGAVDANRNAGGDVGSAYFDRMGVLAAFSGLARSTGTKLAEVIAYAGAHDATTRAKLAAYLKRYGLT